MQDSLIPLNNIEDLDTFDWNINFNQIMTPKRGVDPYIYLTDGFFESANKNMDALSIQLLNGE